MDLELTLKRSDLLPLRTFGAISSADGAQIGYTLEDKVRPAGEFISGETAIPYGRYRLIISFSNRFQKQMLQLINVRGSNILFHGVSIDACGIRIHGGNKEADTLGCVLVGSQREGDETISNCAPIVDKIFNMVQEADKTGEVYLNIV